MAKEDGQFKKGWAGGPGRPKGITFRSVLREELSKPIPGKGNLTKYQEWARKVIEEAEAGSNPAKFEVIKFLEGAAPLNNGEPPEEVEDAALADDNGNPLQS